MQFELSSDSLSFVVNRFVSIASQALRLHTWLFRMPHRTGRKAWTACGYLPKYLKNMGGKRCATRLISFSKCSSSLNSCLLQKIISCSNCFHKSYASMSNEHGQLSHAPEWRNLILHSTSVIWTTNVKVLASLPVCVMMMLRDWWPSKPTSTVPQPSCSLHRGCLPLWCFGLMCSVLPIIWQFHLNHFLECGSCTISAYVRMAWLIFFIKD